MIKPAEDTPLSTINFVQTLIDAGLPPGVVNIVTGDGPQTGEPLARHPDVKVVSFTGSTATGQHITRVAGETMKRVSLEMGGKNAIIVMDDADLDLAVEGAVWGAFGTTGQRCTASSRIIAHRAIADELGRRLAERASAMTVGSGPRRSDDDGTVDQPAAVRNGPGLRADR